MALNASAASWACSIVCTACDLLMVHLTVPHPTSRACLVCAAAEPGCAAVQPGWLEVGHDRHTQCVCRRVSPAPPLMPATHA